MKWPRSLARSHLGKLAAITIAVGFAVTSNSVVALEQDCSEGSILVSVEERADETIKRCICYPRFVAEGGRCVERPGTGVVALLSAILGSVHRYDPETTESTPLVLGEKLRSGEQILTHPGGSVRLILSEEAFLDVGPDTRASVQRDDSGNFDVIVRAAGWTHARIKDLETGIKDLDTTGRYRMRIGMTGGRGGVRGTEIATFSEGESSVLLVFEGFFEAIDESTGESTEIGAGERVVFRDGKIVSLETFDPRFINRWWESLD